MFYKIGVLKTFAIFTRKHLCWSLFLINFQVFRSAALFEKDSNTDVFLWILQNFYEQLFYRTTLLAPSGNYFTKAKLITKLVIFYDWKFFMVVKVFCLYLELFQYQRGDALGKRLSSSIWSLHKKDTLQSIVFPFIVRIYHLLIWNNLQIPVDLPPLTKKKKNKGKHHIQWSEDISHWHNLAGPSHTITVQ